jgi:SAM-dependent methyltransferase
VTAKQAEIDYLKNIGPANARLARDKPFSEPDCGGHLMELGAILRLLPPPPARLLDLGCGTGWTSCFLARRGYDVLGLDLSPDMIRHARHNQQRYQVNVRFQVGDYEEADFQGEFDAVLFFDALHHSQSEAAALKTAFAALKPGGVCIASEPGAGHSRHPCTQEVVRRLHVTERDMEPRRILRAGRRVGFRTGRVYPHARAVADLVFAQPGRAVPFLPALRALVRVLRLVREVSWGRMRSGIVVMVK